MRSRTNCSIDSGQVHSWALGLLVDAKLVKDHGWKCTAAVALSVTLRAAASRYPPQAEANKADTSRQPKEVRASTPARPTSTSCGRWASPY